MSDDILKGNYSLSTPLPASENSAKPESISEELRKKAMTSLGGSMVYMERRNLTWNGETETEK